MSEPESLPSESDGDTVALPLNGCTNYISQAIRLWVLLKTCGLCSFNSDFLMQDEKGIQLENIVMHWILLFVRP